MGRPRKPKTELVLVHGIQDSEIKKRPDDLSPKIERGTMIETPAALKSDYAKLQWNVILSQFITSQLVTFADIPTLEQAFVLLEEYHDTVEALAKVRERFTDYTDDVRINKLYKLNSTLSKAINGYNSIMYRFGISPVERAKFTLFEPTETNMRDAIDVIIGE